MNASILPAQYDWTLVALSLAIAICASYTALDLAGRTTNAHGRMRIYWITFGAVAMGLGIWAMHYIGMLALHLPVPVLYDIPLVGVSLFAAVASSFAALLIVGRERLTKPYLIIGSLVMGIGITAMHYVGMAAMRLTAIQTYNPRIVALSCGIAVAVSYVALNLTFRLRDVAANPRWLRFASALVMGLAIASMHYTGMAAVCFHQHHLVANDARAVSVSTLGIFGIAGFTLAVLALTLVGSFADRHFEMQQQLLQSEQERWRLVINANQDGLFDADLISGSVFYSPRWKEMLGYEPDELDSTFEVWKERIHPQDRSVLEATIERYFHGCEGLLEVEYRLQHRDGTWRWILARGQAVWDSQGHPLRLVGSHSDITQQKQSLEDMKISEARYRELFESNPLPSWVYSPKELKIKDVNEAAVNHYGWSRAEFLGKDLRSICSDQDLDALEAEFRDPSRRNRPTLPRLHRRNGKSDIWVELSGNEIHVTGLPLRLVMANDITARIASEAETKLSQDHLESLVLQRTMELQTSEAKWRGLVEALPQFVWSTRPDGYCDYLSNQLIDYTGIPFSELAGFGWLTAIHPADGERVAACWQAAVSTGSEFDVEYRVRSKEGAYRWFMARGRPVRAGEQGDITHWLGVSTDIDDQKRSAERLEAAVSERTLALAEAKDRAECAVKIKSDFLAVMSHEIRTPMNGVIGMTHLMLDTSLTAEQRRHVETIRCSGQALMTIINDILDFSKIEAGKVELENAPFELKSLVDECIHLVSHEARRKGIDISAGLPEELFSSTRKTGSVSSSPAQDLTRSVLPCQLASEPFALHREFIGDAGRLRQILLNLLSNAVKFTSQGAVSVSISTDSRAHHINEDVRGLYFEVRDTGLGISPEEQTTLFQPFTQADLSTTRRFGGTGLGLSIAKRLVELMGGEIGVSSRIGEGSTFWFSLPLRLSSRNEIQSRLATAPRMKGGSNFKDMFAHTRARVLVADDVVTNQSVALGILQKMGIVADAVANGSEAIHALQSLPYDLVLMDVRMPVMDGLEATRQIRSQKIAAGGSGLNRIPVIALTASAMEEDRAECLASGMDDFLSKPISPRSLAAALTKWLADNGAPQPTQEPAQALLA